MVKIVDKSIAFYLCNSLQLKQQENGGNRMNKLTVQQFAEKSGLTPRQVYYFIAIKKIKATKIADVYWINPSQLEKVK